MGRPRREGGLRGCRSRDRHPPRSQLQGQRQSPAKSCRRLILNTVSASWTATSSTARSRSISCFRCVPSWASQTIGCRSGSLSLRRPAPILVAGSRECLATMPPARSSVTSRAGAGLKSERKKGRTEEDHAHQRRTSRSTSATWRNALCAPPGRAGRTSTRSRPRSSCASMSATPRRSRTVRARAPRGWRAAA